jgi:hypothetical protein
MWLFFLLFRKSNDKYVKLHSLPQGNIVFPYFLQEIAYNAIYCYLFLSCKRIDAGDSMICVQCEILACCLSELFKQSSFLEQLIVTRCEEIQTSVQFKQFHGLASIHNLSVWR